MASAPLLLAAAPPEGALQIDDIIWWASAMCRGGLVATSTSVMEASLSTAIVAASCLYRDEITAANLDRDTRPLIDGTTGKLIFLPLSAAEKLSDYLGPASTF